MTEPSPRNPIPWRRWNAALHRDFGYLAVGLTLVYAISGLAVNHMADWNPIYRKTTEIRQLGTFDKEQPEEVLVSQARERLALGAPKASHQLDAETLKLIYPGRTVLVDLPTGSATLEGLEPRPGLYAINRLHLNAPKGAWTWIADAYAVILAFLALSGLFLLRGRAGLLGRGKWFVAIGVLVPVAYWVLVASRQG